MNEEEDRGKDNGGVREGRNITWLCMAVKAQGLS